MMAQRQVAEVEQTGYSGKAKAVLLAISAWIVPGMGHALQRRFGRALIYFSSVGVLVAIGVAMHGNIFTWEGANDAFDFLGFLSNAGTGLFYYAAHSLGGATIDVAHAAGDYGTRFFAVAGVLNLLCVMEAYEIARGRKS